MAIEEKSELQPLTRFETAFVEHYISTWNAALAYRMVGGKSKTRSDVQGFRILQRPHIKARIETRLQELSMEANEALERLAEQARLNPAEFFFFEMVPVVDSNHQPIIDPKTGKPEMALQKTGINWAAVQKRGYLVKGIEYDRRGNVILKFHDSQRALELIGKNLKLFTEGLDLSVLVKGLKAYVGISPEDWDELTPAEPPTNTEYESEP